MTFTKLLPDDRCKEVLEHVINNISHYEKPLIHWRLQQVKDKFLLLVDTRHSSETFKECILFVKSRLICLMACFCPSGGKTAERVTLGIYQGPYP
jgi:hypothetical protein